MLLYARVIRLPLEAFVQVLGFVVCFLVQLKLRHNCETKNVQPGMCPTKLFVAGATITTAVRHLPERIPVPSPVGGWV